ncbi:hypothetical protein [Flavobacterium denitrificans]|uniref:hypothetical protein n=1 Tax=Flavobacterium denitrificans TaxID=281361 RepID=UPI00040EE6EC|nr:hypothetical protein [Flavobacterium denitrificans]
MSVKAENSAKASRLKSVKLKKKRWKEEKSYMCQRKIKMQILRCQRVKKKIGKRLKKTP